MRLRSNAEAGFTLVELMIVVGIIGLLSAIAVPNFISYQARSRRSEAYVNLAAVARIQSTYHAERGEFFEAGAWPNFAAHGGLSTRKMEWDAASEARLCGTRVAAGGGGLLRLRHHHRRPVLFVHSVFYRFGIRRCR